MIHRSNSGKPRTTYVALTRIPVLLVIFTAVGCAGPPTQTAMTDEASTIPIANRLAGTVDVRLTALSEASKSAPSRIDSTRLNSIVEESLTRSELFDGGVVSDYADFRLSGTILARNESLPGLMSTLEAMVEFEWRLQHQGGNIIWRKRIRSSGKATFGDSPVPPIRLRLAEENAARANIASAIQEMSGLETKGQHSSSE